MSVKYRIEVYKDGREITAKFEVRVTDMASSELLSGFHVSVEGQNLVGDFIAGQKEFTGTRFATLKKSDEDAAVSFDISSSEPWTDSGSDILRGARLRDDCSFEN
jgi:hypothetical protein